MQSCQGHLRHCKLKAFSPSMCEWVSTGVCVCVCVSLSGFLVNRKSIFNYILCFPPNFLALSDLASIAFSRHVCVEYFSQILFWFCFVLLGVKLSKMHRKTTTTKIKFDGKLQFGWARDSVSQSGYDYDDCGNGDRNDDDDDDDSDECDCDCELELNVEL